MSSDVLCAIARGLSVKNASGREFPGSRQRLKRSLGDGRFHSMVAAAVPQALAKDIRRWLSAH
jgi:hypothetical protein